MSEDVANDGGGSGLASLGVDRGNASAEAQSETFGSDIPGGEDDVLLLGPVWSSADHRVCAEHLELGARGGVDVLLVTLTESADERIAHLREHLVRLPDRIAVVSASDDRSSETSVASEGGETTVSIDVVGDPSDLPRLGMSIQSAAAELAGGRPTLVCFHSLTALLQYADTQRVFRFLHILQNAIEARTHFHMDADSHDERTVRTLRPLFDSVVEFEDGTRIVTE